MCSFKSPTISPTDDNRPRRLVNQLHEAAVNHTQQQGEKKPKTNRHLVLSARLSSIIRATKATSPPGVIISISAPVQTCGSELSVLFVPEKRDEKLTACGVNSLDAASEAISSCDE